MFQSLLAIAVLITIPIVLFAIHPIVGALYMIPFTCGMVSAFFK